MFSRIMWVAWVAVFAGQVCAQSWVDENIKIGMSALESGKFAEAKAAFGTALKSDAKESRALHGMALAHLGSGEIGKACSTIDQLLAMYPKPDRSMVINAMACHLAAKNRARAAKLARDYLTANPQALDEPMVNALGTALSGASATERKNRLFTDTVAFYEMVNKRLEAARPGYKRFGAEWYAASEANAKFAAMRAGEKELDRLGAAIDAAEQQVTKWENEINRQTTLMVKHKDPQAPGLLAKAQAELPKAQDGVAAAQKAYDEYAATIVRPQFAKQIATVAIGELNPPAFAAVITKPTTQPTQPTTVAVAPTTNTVVAATQPSTAPATQPTQVTVNPSTSKPAPKKQVKTLAAFAVSFDLVVTAAEGIDENCEARVQLKDGRPFAAKLVRVDPKANLALFRVQTVRLPHLPLGEKFEGGAITCVGFPEDDVFNPQLRGMNGKAEAFPSEGMAWTIALKVHPRLAGAPVFAEGQVIGVCLAPKDAMPGSLASVPLATLKAFLGMDLNDARPIRPGQDVAASIVQVNVTTTQSTATSNE